MRKGHLKDLTGQQFGRWSVESLDTFYYVPSGQRKTYWICKCACGQKKSVYSRSLLTGKSTSCGCLAQEKRTRPFGAAALTCLYSSYRSKCKRQKLDFKITEKQFYEITQQDCFYCGIPPSNHHKQRKLNGGYVYNGIDRINNTKGYIEGNVVASCKNCNLAKRTLSIYEFFKLVERIAEKHFLCQK